MKAWIITKYGPASKFEEAYVPDPVAGKGYVVIKVAATSLNPVDYKIRTLDRPIKPVSGILHMDVAGTVEQIGDGVTKFKPGDKVYGCAGGLTYMPGALAEFMLVDTRLIAHMPESIGFREAAALPLVSITAWESLFSRLKIEEQKEHPILIHAGTGGVGHIAVQLASITGIPVHTTVSSESKAEMAKQLGADQIIYRTHESIPEYVTRLTDGKGYQRIFDTVGGQVLENSFEAMANSGQVVSINTDAQHSLSKLHVKGGTLHVTFMLLPMLTGIGREAHGIILGKIASYVDEGRLAPLLEPERFGFTSANEAHTLFAKKEHVGKIVIEAD